MEPHPILEELPILIVDDDEEVLKAIGRMLGRESWPHRLVSGGAEGLGALAEAPYSVVVSDYRMPGMDGVQFLTQVRERWPEAERILLTAYADTEALERGINEAAISRFLRKPWKRTVLLNILDQARSQNRMRREHAVLQDRVSNRNEELSYLNRLLRDSVEESARTIVRFRRWWDVALSAISDPIIIVGSSLRVEGANDAAVNLRHDSFDDIEGRSCHEVLFDAPSPCAGCPLETGRGEVRPDPQRVYDARAFELTGETRLCVYRDVTRDLAFQAEAAHMEKMAAIGRLAGGVAHEINNPLHGILSFVQLAQKGGVGPEKIARYHEAIKECALRCRDIVSSMRTLSRRETMGDPKPVDLRQVLDKAMLLFARVDGCEIEQQITTDAAHCLGHGGRLQQVVINLVQNAIDASPKGGLIRIRLELDEADVVLAVEDQGDGVPPGERDRIFEPFYTTKPEGVGTGLGLAISHTIMGEHGGHLRVHDSDLGGARFELRLQSRPATAGAQ